MSKGVITKDGTLDLFYGDNPLADAPITDPDYVRLLVNHASINPSDSINRSGMFPIGAKVKPDACGFEASGLVIEAGDRAKDLLNKRVHVWADERGTGAWCERMVVHRNDCTILTDNITYEEGCNQLCNPLSATGMIWEAQTQLKAKTIVIDCATAAICKMMLKLGLRDSLTMIAVVRDQPGIDQMKEIGVEHVLNVSSETFTADMTKMFEELKPELFIDCLNSDNITQKVYNAMPFGSSCWLFGCFESSGINNGFFHLKNVRSWFVRIFRETYQQYEYQLRMKAMSDILPGRPCHTKINKKFPLNKWEAALESSEKDGKNGKTCFDLSYQFENLPEIEQAPTMPAMEYVRLGGSGLLVSRIGYGNWITSAGGASQKMNELVKCAYDHGVNFFDTAEAYDMGLGEQQMGNAIRALGCPRNEVIVATKIFWGGVRGANSKLRQNQFGTSRKHMVEGMDRSLKNLKMDYVDVVFCHRYDIHTPMKETLQAIKEILDSGRAFYWGTSQWPGVRIMEAIHMCDKLQMPRPIVEQCQYNMFVRDKMEKEYLALFDDYKFGTTVWSPLAGGVLTGKYNNGIPEGSRLHANDSLSGVYNTYFKDEKKLPKTLEAFKKLQEVCDNDLKCTLAQLALAWNMSYGPCTVSLVGASSIDQLKENFVALDVRSRMTSEVLSKVETILAELGTRPATDIDFRKWLPKPPRRS